MNNKELIDQVIKSLDAGEYTSIATIGLSLSVICFFVLWIFFGINFVTFFIPFLVISYTIFRLFDHWRTKKLILRDISNTASIYQSHGLSREDALKKAIDLMRATAAAVDYEDQDKSNLPPDVSLMKSMRTLAYRPLHAVPKKRRYASTSYHESQNYPEMPPVETDTDFAKFLGGKSVHDIAGNDPLSALASAGKAHIEMYLRHLGPLASSEKGKLNLKVDYVSAPGLNSPFHLNGCAGRIGETLCLALDFALIPRFVDLAGSYLVVAKAFPQVGDSSETIEEVHLQNRFPGFQSLTDVRKHFYPRCEERRAMSLEITFIMLLFAWHHEFSHAIEGHIDFIEKHAHLKKLWERHYGKPMPFFQDAEHHADRESTYAVVYFLLKNCDYLSKILPYGHFATINAPEKLEMILTSLMLLFVFWDTAEMLLVGKPISRDHSSIPLRLQAVRIKLASFVKSEFPEIEFEPVWMNVEKLLAKYASSFGRSDIHPHQGWDVLGLDHDLVSVLIQRVPAFERELKAYRFTPMHAT